MESSNVSLLSHWLENGHVLFKDGFEMMMFPFRGYLLGVIII